MNLTIGSGNTPVTVNQENGAQVTFTLSGGNYTAPPRVQATLVKNADGTWTFVRQARETFVFDSSGRLSAIKDLNNETTTLAYSAGKLATVTDPSGRTLSFVYSGSLLASVTDSASPPRSVQFAYDSNGDLTSATDVAGGVTTMEYDASHRMTRMLDPNQQAAPVKHYLENAYDSTTGRVTAQTDSAGRTTSFDYTSIPGATKITDPKGNVTVERFVGGLPATITKGFGTPQEATWTVGYDFQTSMPTAVADPTGRLVTMTYDAKGNMLTRVDGVEVGTPASSNPGRKTTYTYNARNQVLTLQDPKGVTTTFAYNTNGNLTSRSTPLTGTSSTQVVSYAYGDPSHPGDATSMTDAAGKVWTFAYDAAGSLSSATDPSTPTASVTKYCYDSIGWRTRQITPKGTAAGVTCATANPANTYVYTHNAFGDVLTETDPNGHQTVRAYDADRNLVSVTDPDANETTYDYNLVGEVTGINRADGTSLANDYWPDGTLKAQIDGAGAATSYDYDPLGRLVSVTDPANRTTTFVVDAAGNVTGKADPGGNCSSTPKVACTTYAYDAAAQVTSLVYSDGLTPNVTFAYDKDGQRTAMTDGTGTTNWTWDSLHRITAQTTQAGTGSAQTTNYAYDLNNQNTSITYAAGKVVTRTYDPAGRLAGVTDWDNRTTTFGYDANSNQVSTTYPTGQLVDTFTYNDADQQTGTTITAAGNPLASLTYTRTNSGLLASLTQTGLPGNATETYGYDPVNRLTDRNSTQEWDYDPADNLTQTTGTTSTRQVFDVANQLCFTAPTSVTGGSCATPPSGATTFAYDNRGNRTSATAPAAVFATQYAYDQANRLTNVTKPNVTSPEGAYTPLAPARVLDTTNGTGTCTPSPCARLNANTSTDIQITGQGGVPAAGVSAVVVNLTAVNPSAAGSIVAYPTGATPPNAPNVQYASGQTIASEAVVPVGANGTITIASNSAAADVIVDVEGYHATSSGPPGSYYTPVVPARILDTRNGTGTCTPSPCAKLQANTPVSVQVAGKGGLPATGVTAVAFTVIAADSTTTGNIKAWASGDTQPATQNHQFTAGNSQELMIVKVGSDGRIMLNATASVHVVGEVHGWWGPGGGTFTPVASSRVLDTRGAPNGPIGTCTPSPCAAHRGWVHRHRAARRPRRPPRDRPHLGHRHDHRVQPVGQRQPHHLPVRRDRPDHIDDELQHRPNDLEPHDHRDRRRRGHQTQGRNRSGRHRDRRDRLHHLNHQHLGVRVQRRRAPHQEDRTRRHHDRVHLDTRKPADGPRREAQRPDHPHLLPLRARRPPHRTDQPRRQRLLAPPRPARLHPHAHRHQRHSRRNVHLRRLRRPHRHDRHRDHTTRLRRPIHRPRNRTPIPPRPLLRPNHRAVPHPRPPRHDHGSAVRVCHERPAERK